MRELQCRMRMVRKASHALSASLFKSFTACPPSMLALSCKITEHSLI